MSPKWSSSSLLLTVSAYSLLVSSVLGKCECGYSVKGQGTYTDVTYTDAFEADFFRQGDIKNDKDWDIQRHLELSEGNIPMKYSLDNVIAKALPQSSGDPGLQLFARGYTDDGSPVSTAALVTTRVDMHYGSYRAAIKTSTVPGTCASMFWMRDDPYHNETKQEIDFEILSYQDTDASPEKEIHLVLHGTNARGDVGEEHQKPSVPFRPSDGFHEYRFDWSPGNVAFFIDGQHVHDFTDRVPTVPGRIILNNWSHGLEGWDQGPPKQDNLMTVAYVKAYFNTNLPAPQRCVDSEAKDAVCEVPHQMGPVSPETPTTFLTDVNSISPGAGPDSPVKPSTSSTAEPAPTKTSSGKISPDNKCGGDEGFTCLNGPAGDCCSSAGYCGSKPEYCNEGCQSAFGKCGPEATRKLARSRIARHQ